MANQPGSAFMPFSLLLRHIRGAMRKFSESRPPKGLVIVLAHTLTMMVIMAGPSVGQKPGDSATQTSKSDSASRSSADLVHQQRYSRRQLRALVRNVRTADDHATLAAYFRAQEREFRTKEAVQQELLQEYLKEHTKCPSKYPTRGDTARDLAAYYGLQAQKASRLALEQEELANKLRTRK